MMKVNPVIHPQWLSVKLLERTKEEDEKAGIGSLPCLYLHITSMDEG